VNIPQGKIPSGGLVNGLAIDPRDSNVVYAAASFGGIWKTTDAGKTWKSLTNGQVPMVYGDIVMDPKNPDTLYALLGEFWPSLVREYGYLANGIMRTRDAGKTWTLIGADVFNGATVSALDFDAEGNIYAASGLKVPFPAPPDRADFGVFKSSDGGDTWKRLLACGDRCKLDGVDDIAGGFMDLHVGGGGAIYVVLCHFLCEGTDLLRSKNGGKTWDALDFRNVLRAWEKASKAKVTRSDYTGEVGVSGLKLAVARDDPDLLLAGAGLNVKFDKGPSWATAWSFAMRSKDGGDTWEWLPGAADYCTANGSNNQCTYDNIVEIDPTNSKIMYLGGSFAREDATNYWHQVIQRSTDGGKTWTDMNPAEHPQSWMHPDSHGMAIDPNDHNTVWVGGDGGIYRTRDAGKDPPVWQHMSNGIDTLLFIGIGLHPTNPDVMIGGLQDNGAALTTDRGKTWPGSNQGDNGYTAFDPFDPEIVYTTWLASDFARNENGGQGRYGEDWFQYSDGLDPNDNWLAYAPFVVDPKNEGVLYFASNRVYKTTDRGENWSTVSDALSRKGSVRTLALAPSDSKVLYAGTTEGNVWVTTDSAKKWRRISGKDFPPRIVNRIAVDPKNPQVAVAVFGSFNVVTPRKRGHVFRTTDGGKTWKDISYNLPDAPVGAVVVDTRPKYAGIYIGGSLGMWVLRDGSQQWLPYGTGMPYSLVSDIQLNTKTGIMAVSTYGRSIWVMEMP
jgi:photosystem II stability/assembly factor-like uncharacterized protein